MNRVLLMYSLFFIVTFFSCNKPENNEMIVVRNCTSTYLRTNATDYFVCNNESLDNFENGTKIIAKYKFIEDCDKTAICMLLPPYQAIVKITSIK